MHDWREILKQSITSADQLAAKCPEIDKAEIRRVIRNYPMCVNPYYLNLIEKKDDPIWKQCIPDTNEVDLDTGLVDPLCEEEDSPVPGLTHRYPDRVLLLVSNRCAMYCRFCTRKRKVGNPFKAIFKKQILQGIDYIRAHPEVRDVLLSGGDPLLLSDERLEFILKELKKIPHVEMIRLGTRVPCTLPQRITPELCAMLKKYKPFYVNTHFNHPRELTAESKKACALLVDAGIPLGNQTVMLKGINDNSEVMKELMYGLLQMRVKPYYIYQADFLKGTDHLRTNVKKSLEIIDNLRMFNLDLPTPHFIIDSPGGGGKIPVFPEYAERKDEEGIFVIYSKEDLANWTPGQRAVKISMSLADPSFADIVYHIRSNDSNGIILLDCAELSDSPQYVSDDLCMFLSKNHPIYATTYFNKVSEIEDIHINAVSKLVDSGVPVINTTILFKKYNDTPEEMKRLMHLLLRIRVKPNFLTYDTSTNAVKMKTKSCNKVLSTLRGFTSGLAVPQLVISEKNSKKITGPNYIVSNDERCIILRNYEDKLFDYPEPMEGCELRKFAKAAVTEQSLKPTTAANLN